jgi:hypothetical protein
MPGGPALLDMAGATLLEAETTRAGLSFLIQSHAIEDAFLNAHAGCGFDKKRLAGQAPDKIYDRQVKDLQSAAAWIRRLFPRVNVHAFMATIDGPPEYDEARVCFERIEIGPTTTTLLLLGGVPDCRTELGAARNLGRDERRGRMAIAM